MRFKLDENLAEWAKDPLITAGHDVATVVEQQLTGADDRTLIEACTSERRCLVTLDAEFGNPMMFPPRQHRGIVLLRIPPRGSKPHIVAAITSLAEAVEVERSRLESVCDSNGPIDRSLWIAQPGRVRIYQPERE